MKKIGKAISRIDYFLIAILVTAIFVDVMLQVLGRLTPGSSFSWTVEMGQILLGALIWLGISVGVREGTHVSFDMLVERLPKKVQDVIRIVDDVCFIVYLVCLCYFSYTMISTYFRLGKMSSLLHVNIGYLRLPMLIGSAFGALVLVIKVINEVIQMSKRGREGN